MMVDVLVLECRVEGRIMRAMTCHVIFYGRTGRLPGEGWVGSPQIAGTLVKFIAGAIKPIKVYDSLLGNRIMRRHGKFAFRKKIIAHPFKEH
jgi:hypothetical protein